MQIDRRPGLRLPPRGGSGFKLCRGVSINISRQVSLREEGVDLSGDIVINNRFVIVSLREEGVDLSDHGLSQSVREGSPSARREWI